MPKFIIQSVETFKTLYVVEAEDLEDAEDKFDETNTADLDFNNKHNVELLAGEYVGELIYDITEIDDIDYDELKASVEEVDEKPAKTN